MKKKILAAAWHPGGANALSPVIKRLHKEGKAGVVTIGHQYSEKIFQNNGIAYETIGFYGLNDVSVASMEQLLRKESPDLVLTGTAFQSEENKDVIEQTMTLAARNKGIRKLTVMDFWPNDSKEFSDVYSPDGKFKFLPDKIAVIDRSAEEIMAKEGFPREKLLVTGNPYFDELIKLKEKFGREDRRKVRADLQIDPKSYLLLFASQPIEHDFGDGLGYTEKTALEELLGALTKWPEKKTSLLVKVHPREVVKDLERVVEKYSVPAVVNQTYPTRPALLAADAVIAPFSTVLVEASYLDKPAISLQPGLKKNDFLVTNKLGVTLPVYEHGKIESVLNKLLFDKKYAAELARKRKDFRTDGRATERVTNLVYQMLKQV